MHVFISRALQKVIKEAPKKQTQLREACKTVIGTRRAADCTQFLCDSPLLCVPAAALWASLCLRAPESGARAVFAATCSRSLSLSSDSSSLTLLVYIYSIVAFSLHSTY